MCRKPADTARLAGRLIKDFNATVWLLQGPLGAGKTTLVRGLLRALGYTGRVTSPTFTLQHPYRLRHQRWDYVVHVDAYRLRRKSEAAALDLTAWQANPRCLLVVEWPERLHLTADHPLKIRLDYHPRGRLVRVRY